MYSLSFGKNADWKFVKQLAGQNNGVGRKIYEDSDASLQVKPFALKTTVSLCIAPYALLNDSYVIIKQASDSFL